MLEVGTFTAMSVDGVKKIFNEKVNDFNDASSDRSLFLDNERYDKILWEVKEAQILGKNNQPLTSKHNERYDNILWEVKEARLLRKNNPPLTSKHYRHLTSLLIY
jgi:UDP-3-O-[3-hydroxymyristoyl] glucosamine N-acyltransferase